MEILLFQSVLQFAAMKEEAVVVVVSFDSSSRLRDKSASSLALYVIISNPIIIFVVLSGSRMDRKAEIDNLETRLQTLESRIYGERRNRGGKTVKVCPRRFSYKCTKAIEVDSKRANVRWLAV